MQSGKLYKREMVFCFFNKEINKELSSDEEKAPYQTIINL